MEMNKEKIIETIGVLGLILYILSHWIEPRIVLIFTGCCMWAIEAIYKLTKWKELSLFNKIINIIILLLIINVFVYEITLLIV